MQGSEHDFSVLLSMTGQIVTIRIYISEGADFPAVSRKFYEN